MIVCNCTLSIIKSIPPYEYISSLDSFLSVVSMRKVHPEHPPGLPPTLTNVLVGSIFSVNESLKTEIVIRDLSVTCM